MAGRSGTARILEVSSYPPPRAGWGVRIAFLRAHLTREGHVCRVLNVGPSRRVRSTDYDDVQNGLDLVRKVLRYAFSGHLLHAHLNGDSPKGLAIALLVLTAGLVSGRRAALTFHAGPEQRFFPRARSRLLAPLYRLAFRLARVVICNSQPVKDGIVAYGIEAEKVRAIPAFSVQYLRFTQRPVPREVEALAARYRRLIASYFFHRPEFFVETMLEGLGRLAGTHGDFGLVLIGGDSRSEAVTRLVERAGLRERTCQAGDLEHDEFMSVLSRAHVFLRGPKKDGVCSSVLEALSVGVPVVASENGTRPAGVVTYRADDPADLAARLGEVLRDYEAVLAGTHPPAVRDTVAEEAELLVELSLGR